jgi:hypothetical protein
MILFYADESGTPHDPKQLFFVLAGFCIFERQIHWLSNSLEAIAERFNPGDSSSVELHASPMMKGRGFWRQFAKEERINGIKDCLKIFANSHSENRMFACVIRKSTLVAKDVVEYSFEQLASRFDYYLIKKHKTNDTQRGIFIFDKSTYENTIQNLATDFKKIGHTWGVIKNMAEVPLFLDSKASRLIQLADLIAYAIYKHYEHQDDQFYSIISERWENDGIKNHGLYEKLM